MIRRRHLLGGGASAILSSCLPLSAFSDTYPNRPIQILIGFSAGSSTDVLMRIVAQKLGEMWGHHPVIVNRTGAGGTTAAAAVARANPDGYTLYFSNGGLATGASLYKNLSYNSRTDFAPVALVARMPHLACVDPALPVKSISDLIALARSKQGSLLFSSAGFGNSDHMAAELFLHMTNTKMVHLPSKGGPEALYDVIQHRAAVTFTGPPIGLPAIKVGTVRAIAVTSTKRSPDLPDVPTMEEAGVAGYEHTQWNGLFAPAETPPEIVNKLNSDVVQALAASDVRSRLDAIGAESPAMSPMEFSQFFRGQLDKWETVIKVTGMKQIE